MFVFISCAMALIHVLPTNTHLKTYSHSLLANQITQGFFSPLQGSNCKYAVTIESVSDERTLFYSPNLTPNEKTHFSFVNDEPKELRIYIEALPIDPNIPHESGKMQLSFYSKFNTFDKDVAKSHAVEPAIKQLIEFEKLLHQIIVRTQAKKEKMLAIMRSQKTLFASVTFLSFLTFVVFVGVNLYQMKKIEKFFRMKKLL
ncbi:putative Emp24/Gp25L/p24 protein [Trachipleistophora hominis]|uniref:Putative Emp24/Gp25L/p24 protein n=1 Tax=Trachipleistophora hominis TaxID=72359 RepID=L7JZI0_TRAHO|nr:putative Emp24/Gp25L/p24 protein [Trachipleistophora hominis]